MKRFSPNEVRTLLFQGTQFNIINPGRFMPGPNQSSDGEHLLLEDTKGAYYLIPVPLLGEYKLTPSQRDALQKHLGSDTTGYGHFNPHHITPFSPEEFADRVSEALRGPDRFFQGGLFQIPVTVDLPDAARRDLRVPNSAETALVLQDLEANFYVIPVDALRRFVIPKERRRELDEVVGLEPPHPTW